jgi:uncharacterized 2Fe-2S/4Fe-4S cluster protein (DUF4445 family)
MVLRVPDPGVASLRVVTETHLLLDEAALPEPGETTPPVSAVMLQVPPATVETGYGDLERLALALAPWRGGPLTEGLRCSLSLLRRIPELLRADDGRVTALVADEGDAVRLVDLLPGADPTAHLGAACDLGTTTVALHLVDLASGEILATRSAYNRQASQGADVITRIDYARKPGHLEELRQLALTTINGLLAQACEAAGRELGRIHCFTMAGNTTMVHLLLGLPPSHIREAPYVPVTNGPPTLTARDVGLLGHPEARVLFAPGVGSYVGGDISAGLLATRAARSDEGVFLFMDIGTNGEIALGTDDWMVTCACSAGPAFEGSGIRCGMRATEGAIERVSLSPDGETVTYDVVGNGRPCGICGSGLVSLLGELLCRGIVDRGGHLLPESGCSRVVAAGATLGFLVEGSGNTASGADLVLTEPDIENLIRSKAAIYAGCDLLLEKVGLTWESVASVVIAGGFGRFLDVERAILLGLLPDLPLSRFHYVGNSSLAGAYLMLLSGEMRREVVRLAAGMTYVDLGSEPGYMDRYVGALFLPHTDLGRFPTVASLGWWPQTTSPPRVVRSRTIHQDTRNT